jgi:hypothetical protein
VRLRQLRERLGDWKKTDKTHAINDVKLLVPTVPTQVLGAGGQL